MDSSCLTSGDILLATRTTANPAALRIDMCAHEYQARQWCFGRVPGGGGGGEGKRQTTYPNSLIDQLASLFQLLRGASDGEDAHVGVGVGRRVSLELHVGTRLLFDVLDGFSTWKRIK